MNSVTQHGISEDILKAIRVAYEVARVYPNSSCPVRVAQEVDLFPDEVGMFVGVMPVIIGKDGLLSLCSGPCDVDLATVVEPFVSMAVVPTELCDTFFLGIDAVIHGYLRNTSLQDLINREDSLAKMRSEACSF